MLGHLPGLGRIQRQPPQLYAKGDFLGIIAFELLMFNFDETSPQSSPNRGIDCVYLGTMVNHVDWSLIFPSANTKVSTPSLIVAAEAVAAHRANRALPP